MVIGRVGFALFDTAIGTCALAWTERGLAGVQLPEANEHATRTRIERRVRGAVEATPPPDVRKAIEGIMALLAGHPDDLSYVELDVDGLPLFNRRVYDVARTIAPGRTMTYGEIAARCGNSADARAVGQALGGTRIRSSCRAIVCSRRMAVLADSPRTVASPRNCVCSRSRARG
jgi:methylated-DNA-[protein]-cysteine S-methyltransferase